MLSRVPPRSLRRVERRTHGRAQFASTPQKDDDASQPASFFQETHARSSPKPPDPTPQRAFPCTPGLTRFASRDAHVLRRYFAVVFAGNGGGRKDVAPLGDVHELNLETGRWRCVCAPGFGEVSPPPRFAHVAVLSDCGAEMLVHGGAGNNGALVENGRVWRLNLQTWEWR